MKRILFVILAFAMSIQAVPQNAHLEQVGNEVKGYIEGQMPGWPHKRGSLIKGSKDIIVELWTLPGRTVKISIMQRESVEDARQRLNNFAREEADAHELKGIGDEAYSWGEESSNIVFRRGKYTIYIGTIVNIDRDPDAKSLTREQKRERRKAEMKQLSMVFAKHAAKAIDAL